MREAHRPAIAGKVLFNRRRDERTQRDVAAEVAARFDSRASGQRLIAHGVDVERQRRVANLGVAVDLGLGVIERDHRADTETGHRHQIAGLGAGQPMAAIGIGRHRIDHAHALDVVMVLAIAEITLGEAAGDTEAGVGTELIALGLGTGRIVAELGARPRDIGGEPGNTVAEAIFEPRAGTDAVDVERVGARGLGDVAAEHVADDED